MINLDIFIYRLFVLGPKNKLLKDMLLQLKNYLAQKQEANLYEISQHFHQPADFMQTLLEYLIRKGKLSRCTKTPACATLCQRCKSDQIEIYRWN